MLRSFSGKNRSKSTKGEAPSRPEDEESLTALILDALRKVYDPEIPVNILDLGLVYGIDRDAENNIHIRMTLTAPACPVAGSMPGMVENAVKQVPGVAHVQVELVWDPPWTKERMSEEARIALNMYD